MDYTTNASTETERFCLICKYFETTKRVVSPLMKIGKKQIESFAKYSLRRVDDFHLQLDTTSDIYVHDKCRKNYASETCTKAYIKEKNKKSLSSEEIGPPTKKTRSSMNDVTSFDWENLCFICSEDLNIKRCSKKHRKSFSAATEDEIRQRILQHIESINICEFQDVYKRLSKVESITELKGKYHRVCYTNLIYKCSYQPKKISNSINDSMEIVYDFMENNPDYQFTYADIEEVLEGYFTPSRKKMQEKLLEKYGEDICFATKFGSKTVIQFKKKNDFILNSHWYEDQKKKARKKKIKKY